MFKKKLNININMQIKLETERSTYLAAKQEKKWERLKDLIKCAAETHIGYKKKVNTQRYTQRDESES